MKVNIQKLKKGLSSLFCVGSVFAVLVCCMMPVSAASIDYNDYVTNVEVDGSNDIVMVTIPAEFAIVQVFDVNKNYQQIYYGKGSSHNIPFSFDVEYRVMIDIFGGIGSDFGLDLSYIPSGTIISSGFGFDNIGDFTLMDVMHPTVQYYYYNSSGFLDADIQQSWNQASQWEYFTDTYAVRSVSGASSLSLQYYWQPVKFEGQEKWSGLTVLDTTMKFSISSLLRQQQLTGKTNAILQKVEQHLAEQGKTLDSILNGTPEQGGAADDFNNSVNDKVEDLENAADDLNQVEKPNVDINDYIPNAVISNNALVNLSAVLGRFWDNPLITQITTLLGGLMLISFVVFGAKG